MYDQTNPDAQTPEMVDAESNQTLYDVFTRTWWREATAEDGTWPNNLVPEAGKKTYMETGVTWAEARRLCQEWNAEHEPGRYSLKAEFEEA